MYLKLKVICTNACFNTFINSLHVYGRSENSTASGRVLAKKTGSGALYEGKEIFLQILHNDPLKSFLFCLHTFGVRRSIDGLEPENQPGFGSIFGQKLDPKALFQVQRAPLNISELVEAPASIGQYICFSSPNQSNQSAGFALLFPFGFLPGGPGNRARSRSDYGLVFILDRRSLLLAQLTHVEKWSFFMM